MSDDDLAYFGSRVSRLPRHSLKRQGVAWALVALVHFFLITLFVISEVLPDDGTHHPAPIETTFLMAMLPNTVAPPVVIIKPEVPSAAAPVIITAPPVLQPAEPPMIQPETPDDILRAIGEALACGANSFEYLTTNQRANCRHEPWTHHQNPDGTIVLDKAPRPVERAQIHISGADQLRHDLQTGGSGCPILQQAPCLHDVVTGGNMKPP